MGRAEALAACDRALLEAFSQQTSLALQGRFALARALPWLGRFLALNVGKEIEKDRRVILRARALVAAQEPPDRKVVAELLAEARAVDRRFLRQVAGLPVDILVPYQAIEPVRARRVERLLSFAYDLLRAWPPGATVRDAIRAAMPRQDLEALVGSLLLLYADETRAISHALRLPFPLRPLRDQLTQGLYAAMAAATRTLARDAAATVHRP